MRNVLVALAGISALAIPAAANASAIITFGSTTAIPGNNDFQGTLAGAPLNLTRVAAGTGTNITLNANSIITFYFLGSESGYSDTFKTTNALPNFFTTETSSIENHFASPVFMGSDTFNLGSLINQVLFTGGVSATVGDAGFGIFLGANDVSGLSTNTFYFGYDDGGAGPDNDYDDFIVKAVVSPAPEPGTWATMLLGFAGIGIALRRRRRQQPALAQVA